MNEDREFQGSMQKIEQLIGKLENAADPATRAVAKELVAALMDVHGGCLARMLDVLKGSGEAGQQVIRAFQNDPLVRNILILYELHSVDLQERVTQAVDKFISSYKGEGVSVQHLSVADGVIHLHFATSSKGCGSGATKSVIEALLLEAAPDAAGIFVEDANPEPIQNFVPLGALQGAMPEHSANQPQRSANQA